MSESYDGMEELYRGSWLTVYVEPLPNGNLRCHFKHNKRHPGYWWHRISWRIECFLFRVAPWLWPEWDA